MNKNYLHVLLLLSAVLLFAGCGTSPSYNYYLLTAQSPTATPTGNSPSLGVGPIEIPEYLTRDELIFNQQANSLQVSQTQRWAEPLSDGIQRILALNLAVMLDTQGVRYFPWHRERSPQYGVKVNVLKLDANKSEATLAAEWLLTRPETRALVQQRISRVKVPMDGSAFSADDVAPAYSELLQQLAEVIADAIREDMAASKPDADSE